MFNFSGAIKDIGKAKTSMNNALINLVTELNELLTTLDNNDIYLYSEDGNYFKIDNFYFNEELNRIEFSESER